MIKKLILFVLMAVSFSACRAQSQDEKAKALAHSMAASLLKTAGLPGLSVAVLKNGNIIYAEGFGYSDIEKKIPVTTATQFRAASVSKVLTATALARLLQEKKLELDAPVQRYVPGFPEKKYPVTVRQLAGHLSGLPHYNDSDRIENRFYPTVKDGLNVFAHEPLLSQPGTAYNYSTHGYTLLSAVVEGASGMTFLDYMEKEIFKPLGMHSSGPDMRQRPSKNMASLYNIDKGVPAIERQPEDPSYKWGAGGMITTPSDLVKLAWAYSSGFLQPQIVDTVFRSQQLISGEKTAVGIGWRISQDVDGRMVRDHAGSMGGARSVVCIYPAEKMAVAVMVNAGWSSMIEETAQMLALPFLSANEMKPALQGQFNLSITAVNGRNEERSHEGRLILNAQSGTLTTDAGLKEKKTMPLFYLGGNRYAWVRPDAICYMEIERNDKKIKGKAIAYGSRLSRNPLTNPPFIKFSSVD